LELRRNHSSKPVIDKVCGRLSKLKAIRLIKILSGLIGLVGLTVCGKKKAVCSALDFLYHRVGEFI